MTDKTARHYRDDRTPPSTRKKSHVPRSYRTRPDPFAAVWAMVEERLAAEPRLLAKTLFDWLRRERPGEFLDSHRRTFERRVRQWRATRGPGKSITFRQVHAAGSLIHIHRNVYSVHSRLIGEGVEARLFEIGRAHV